MNIIILGVRIIEDSDNRGSDNRGCTVHALLASEQSERDTLWSVQLRIADIYIIIIYILWYVQILFL